MSTAFWVGFFRDAGIPSSLAKSYAATFEENRIGKDMLLDLDKGILADMGIKVMGDVIGILKHAKKEARKDPVSGSGTKHNPKPSSAVHSTQSAPQAAPAVSTTSSPLHTHSEEGFMGEAELLEYKDREQELPLEEHMHSVDHQFGTLDSDQLLLQVAAAAVARQAQQQSAEEEEGEGDREERGQVNPAVLGLQQEDEFQEEYVTEAYKRQQQKRALDNLYSEGVFVTTEPPQAKQPRLVILPQADGEDTAGDLQILAAPPPISSETSSRRMLEAAGLVKRERVHVAPCGTDKTAVSSSVSVFSRLDGKSEVSLTKTHTPSSTSTGSAAAPVKRTIVTATSPSPKKLSLRVTSKDGRRTSASGGVASSGSGSGRGMTVTRKSGTKREVSGGGLVSSSSNFSTKEPIRSRLGVRTDHGVTSKGGGDEVISWPDTVSTSIAAVSNSGRVSTRLGGSGGAVMVPRKPRHTMIADSASNPQPKASMRLGTTTTRKTSKTATVAVSSAPCAGSLLRRKPKTSPVSMVADEYELKRQLDVRSRLAEKEKEVEQRRRGPLGGRLGQHRVFQRLT